MRYEGLINDCGRPKIVAAQSTMGDREIVLSSVEDGKFWRGSVKHAEMLFLLFAKALRSEGVDVTNIASRAVTEVARDDYRGQHPR